MADSTPSYVSPHDSTLSDASPHDSTPSEPVTKKPKRDPGEPDFLDENDPRYYDWQVEDNVGADDRLKPIDGENDWLKQTRNVYGGEVELPAEDVQGYVESCKLALEKYYGSYDFVSLDKGTYAHGKLKLSFQAKKKNTNVIPELFEVVLHMTTKTDKIISCKRLN